MEKLAFCDYHNMIAILEKTEHNIDFHQIVDFLEASHIRYALTISPTVYVSHIRQFWSTTRVETTNLETKILATVDVTQGEGSATPTEPHHTPSSQEQHSPHHDPSLPSHPTTTTEPIHQTPTENPTLRRYTRMAIRIAQSKALSPAADKPASLLRNDRQREAFPTVSSLYARQDRENINKTFALPHESSPRVTSLDVDEGNQDLKISGLKARVKFLEDKDIGSAEPTQEDAPIKGGIKETGEEVRAEKSTELGSNDTEEMVNVLSSIEATNILTSRVAVASVSPAVDVLTAGVPTVSGSFPTVSVIFTTASVVTPYTRRPREITIGVAREMEEEFARENKRLSEQLARDSEIARLHVEEELKMMIEGLDRSNEVIAKHLQEYEHAEAELNVREKIELINELVKYQDHHAKILKYQAQQSKPLSKKKQKKFYMSVLRSHAGWKTKHFRGMALEEIKEKFIPVWKQLEYFVPVSSKEEGERVKKKGLKLDQGSAKRMKTSEDVSEEDLKGMIQLVPLEEVYVEALQLKHPIIDWEIHSKEKIEYWKIIRLGVVDFVEGNFKYQTSYKRQGEGVMGRLKRLFEPDFEDQLWTHNQALMHDPVEWKLYDTCGVHHVFSKDQEIFMLVEKDYPLRKELATVMICNKLKVEQYSQMANDLILKIHNIANSPR
nr:hypothetical protein [Tanacetum cinerariifolium]